MATEYIVWHSQPDPRPDALPNLRKAAEYMVSKGATFGDAATSVYSIAKALNRNNTQIANLLKKRPGFVRVELPSGELGGYYYDVQNFGAEYPETYKDQRGRRLKVIDSLSQSRAETVQEFNQRMPEMASNLRKEINKPDVTAWADNDQFPRDTLTTDFPLIPADSCWGVLAEVGQDFVDKKATSRSVHIMLSALLSLARHEKSSRNG